MEAALAELWKVFEVVHQRQLEQVDDSGRAAVERGSPLAGDDRATAPYHMSHMVALALGVAVDHLHALRVAVQEATSLHLYAPYTLLRATIESAATVTYLWGESRRSERVRRRLMLVAQDNRDRANFPSRGGRAWWPECGRPALSAERGRGADASP